MGRKNRDAGFEGLGLVDSPIGGSRSFLCAEGTGKKLWAIGVIAVALVTVITMAVLRKGNAATSDQPGAGTAALDGRGPAGYAGARGGAGMIQPAAFTNSVPPGCAQCPSVSQCFPNAPTAQQVAFSQWQQVALAKPAAVPDIFRDAKMPHGFRGVCASCHLVKPDLPIYRDAKMPHEYRGVCSNCHAIRADVPIAASAQPTHRYRGVCSNCHAILGTAAGVK
jgi:hypothetical protein